MAKHHEHEEQEHVRSPGREAEHVTPAVDIYETGNGHVLLADMPGVTRDGLAVHVGKPDVQEHQVVPAASRGLEPAPAVRRLRDIDVELRQARFDVLLHALGVVDDEDALTAVHPAPSFRAPERLSRVL